MSTFFDGESSIHMLLLLLHRSPPRTASTRPSPPLPPFSNSNFPPYAENVYASPSMFTPHYGDPTAIMAASFSSPQRSSSIADSPHSSSSILSASLESRTSQPIRTCEGQVDPSIELEQHEGDADSSLFDVCLLSMSLPYAA